MGKIMLIIRVKIQAVSIIKDQADIRLNQMLLHFLKREQQAARLFAFYDKGK